MSSDSRSATLQIAVENDCEDQGFTKLSDGCFVCLPDFDRRGKPVRPKIVKRKERGFLLWACEKCGGNYGIIRRLYAH